MQNAAAPDSAGVDPGGHRDAPPSASCPHHSAACSTWPAASFRPGSGAGRTESLRQRQGRVPRCSEVGRRRCRRRPRGGVWSKEPRQTLLIAFLDPPPDVQRQGRRTSEWELRHSLLASRGPPARRLPAASCRASPLVSTRAAHEPLPGAGQARALAFPSCQRRGGEVGDNRQQPQMVIGAAHASLLLLRPLRHALPPPSPLPLGSHRLCNSQRSLHPLA